MTRQVAHDVLRRMASPPPPAPEDVPITSSRAIRLAITRAADKTHGMTLSVSSLREEVMTLDDLLAAFDPALMLIGLMVDGQVAGIAALDLDMRTGLVEVQTIGKILAEPPENRPATGTDARMAQPIIAGFLSHLQETAKRTPLDAWGSGVEIGDKIESARAAGLILDDGDYRSIRLSLNLGDGERVGELTVALPCPPEPPEMQTDEKETGDWDSRFRRVVDGSTARLDAILHRFKLQLHQAEALSVGQVVPLPGCTVSSVKLTTSDGRKVATARLGQSGGMRAVRIEAAPHLEMSEMAYPSEADELPAHDIGFGIDGASTDMGSLDTLEARKRGEELSLGGDDSHAPTAAETLHHKNEGDENSGNA